MRLTQFNSYFYHYLHTFMTNLGDVKNWYIAAVGINYKPCP